MEVTEKILKNLVALSGACLRNERLQASPTVMAELWADISIANETIENSGQESLNEKKPS